jgi:SAM-dependent methyltransferase
MTDAASTSPDDTAADLPVADEAMADEFGTVASWTADAVEELGSSYAVPAGCRGSGSPDALRWLAASMGLTKGTRLLDSGAGVGGPAELVGQELDVAVTLVDPMVDACEAARRLFGRPTAAAVGERRPFADGTFDAAWSLGVLCTVEDQPAVLAELVRVVRPGAPVGLLVFVRAVERLPDQPAGNDFPTAERLQQLLEGAGLTVTHSASLDDFPPAPESWDAAVSEVDELIERDHGRDRRKLRADEQSALIGKLIGSGQVVGRLTVARAPGSQVY